MKSGVKEQLEELLRSRVTGSVIEEVNLYNVNPQRYDIKDCDRQVVDGGIEILLDNKSYFSFGWDSEHNLQNIAFDKFEKKFTGEEIQKLDTRKDHFWKNMIRQRIEKIDLQWTELEVKGNRSLFIPDYIDFQMSFNRRFLVSTMDFDIKKNELINFRSDFEGWIVIFFDEKEIERTIKFIAH